MFGTLVLTLVTAVTPTSGDLAPTVARFADLPDVALSPTIADVSSQQWGLLDRTVAGLPWARRLLNRPDLINGWLQAFKECPAPEKGKFGTRFENLVSLLTYPPFLHKEGGHEGKILVALVSRCAATGTPLPENSCVRFAKAMYPKSKMAHLYDGLRVESGGTAIVFPDDRAIRGYESRRKPAEVELTKLVMAASAG